MRIGYLAQYDADPGYAWMELQPERSFSTMVGSDYPGQRNTPNVYTLAHRRGQTNAESGST